MELTIKIKYIDAISTATTEKLYLCVMTDFGRMHIPLETLLNVVTKEDIYNTPGFVKNAARHLRGKSFDNVDEKLIDIIQSLPKDLFEKFENYKCAAVMCEILGYNFDKYYDDFYNICKIKDLGVKFPEFETQLQIYKSIKRILISSRIFKSKPHYKVYIHKFMKYFDDGIKLMEEVGA